MKLETSIKVQVLKLKQTLIRCFFFI